MREFHGIDSAAVAALCRAAADGRGFWLGAAPVFKWEEHPIRQHLDEDGHVTILHLGKSMTDEHVDAVMRVLDVDSGRQEFPMRAELTGAGWFWRYRAPNTLVGLVNSASLFGYRARLMERLRDAEVPVGDRYGFIPHLTMRPDTSQNQLMALATAGSVQLTLPALRVTCGDVVVVV